MLSHILFWISLLVSFFSQLSIPVNAVDSVGTVDTITQQINDYTQKLATLAKSKDTLSNQIKILNSQVELTLLKINQSEQSIKSLESDINDLSIKIGNLDVNLNQLTADYIKEINLNYRLQKRLSPIPAIFLSSSFNSFLEQYKYIATIQRNSQTTLLNLETARTTFDIQKNQKIDKQTELETLQKKLSDQQASLAKQRTDKTNLLQVTKNDEVRYQKLKAEAQAELESLQTAVFDGTKVVKKGEAIGIMGNTGFSFGAHLHFGLYNLTKEKVANFEYTNDIDSLNFLASHQWPMKNYTITQGRGRTAYSYMYSDHFHHGIDMYSDTNTVYAVDDGIAYFFKDKYPGKKMGTGNHVKLFHADGHMTLYLHLEKFYR
ncbi:peptidoglycan DD-metalloendopeptidase family protein [Candidatus Shapirobacteria bacterium]|nr:peptidoglycan DD-metalloendopeptidase family protein [Candidatus Shapirobacteria bacterium]